MIPYCISESRRVDLETSKKKNFLTVWLLTGLNWILTGLNSWKNYLI